MVNKNTIICTFSFCTPDSIRNMRKLPFRGLLLNDRPRDNYQWKLWLPWVPQGAFGDAIYERRVRDCKTWRHFGHRRLRVSAPWVVLWRARLSESNAPKGDEEVRGWGSERGLVPKVMLFMADKLTFTRATCFALMVIFYTCILVIQRVWENDL